MPEQIPAPTCCQFCPLMDCMALAILFTMLARALSKPEETVLLMLLVLLETVFLMLLHLLTVLLLAWFQAVCTLFFT